MVEIRLKNSKSRRIEVLRPIVAGKVSMYVCGPTVYDRAHIGNARSAVVFDQLFRLLRHVYGAANVTYVRNFTDVDDKINARAAEEGREIADLTAETSQWYLDDTRALGVLDPTHMPRATGYIGEMIAFIEDLIAKGFAYARDGHVLFRVRSFEEYGKLSGRSVDDMIAGARVEVAPYKEDPMDFVLWKPSADGVPGWAGPVWEGKSVGRGRPGWHIECSAMAHAILGPLDPEGKGRFDIHGGGADLMFPHHENEVAQSCAAGHGFANIWMHNEMLQVEGKKMSKSLGNFFTVRDLLDQGIPGEVIRFVMLSTHYGKPMDWTEKKVREAVETLRKWSSVAVEISNVEPDVKVVEALAEDMNLSEALDRLHRLFDDDLRTELVASAMLLGFDLNEISESDWARPFQYELEDGTVLLEGIDYQPTVGVRGWGSVPDALRDASLNVVRRWLSLRRNNDWARADALKAEAAKLGVELRASRSANGVNGGQAVLANNLINPSKLEDL